MSEKTSKNEVINVVVKGEVDIYSVAEFRETIERSLEQEANEIILDCSELTYIDSIGMGVLIEMRNKSCELEKKLMIKNPKPNIKKLLTLTGVNRIIDLIESPC